MVITFDREIMLRTGITRDLPVGSMWICISQPSIESNVKQVALGSFAFWALDYQGDLFFRAGVKDDNPQGYQS